jgi:periplasmic protein TonB
MSSAPTTITNDRLVYMLFLATLFHGVLIMGITFRDRLPDLSARPLEVVLVRQGPPEEAPERARYMAERNQRGGGEDEAAAGEIGTGAPVDTRGSEDGNALETRAGNGAADDADMILTPADASRRVTSVADALPPGQVTLEARLMQAAPASDVLALDPAANTGAGLRERTVSVDTQEALFAGYLAAWKVRVEQLGTLNFPDAARRAGMSGNPVLEVAIGADGALREIVVVRSSQQKLLDQAALRILRLAAPFEPFPEALRREYDVLRFVYEWRFIGQEAVAHR